ncbi:MAG: gliding motility-associated C-terminal domain-containing protein [Flavobacteriales bacterium]
MNGSGPYAYALSNASGLLQNADEMGAATFQMAEPGVYTVEITDAGNCTTEIEIEVLQDDVLQVAVSTVEPTCLADGQFTILPLAGEEPFVVESNGIELNALTSPVSEGNYAIAVTDNNGCSFDTTLIFVLDNPVVADFDYSWEDNQLFLQNESSESNGFGWTLNEVLFSSEENPVLEQSFEPGSYTLVLMAMDSITGCVDSIQKNLTLEDDFALYIPNCITADDDGVNDYFFVQGSLDRLRSFQCSVYNRWGDMVFSTNNANVPWIASVNQAEHYAMDGVYTYRIEYQLKDRIEVEELTGHLTVLR